jgi:signal transduction histidine kinase
MDILILVLGILTVLLGTGSVYLYRAYRKVKLNLNSLQSRYEDLKASDEVLHAKYLNASFEIQEEERKRIASDLHDEIGSGLTALRYNLKALSKRGLLYMDRYDDEFILGDIYKTIDEIIVRNKEIVYGITPTILEQFGLEVAIRTLFDRINSSYRIITEFTQEGALRQLTPKQQLMIYRIVQELLNNAIKYSNRWRFSVHMNWMNDYLEIIIFDDASRLKKQLNYSMGYYNVYSRVKTIGGEIKHEEKNTGNQYIIKLYYEY